MSHLPFEPLWPDSAENHAHRLTIAGCDVDALAEQYGTPLYLLDEVTIVNAVAAYKAGFGQYRADVGIHYAGKALLNTAVAQLMARERIGIDAVSLNELAVVRNAGVDVAHVHFHGNATPSAELAQAMAWGVGCIVVDNLSQLDTLIQLSADRVAPQPVMLRVEPGIVAGGHAHIQTGHAASKFGMPPPVIRDAYARLQRAPHLRLSGLHAHVGSQLRDLDLLGAAIARLLDTARELYVRDGWEMDELCVGGGLAVPTERADPSVSLAAYCDAVVDAVTSGCSRRGLPLPRLTVEPGRSLVARAGVAVYTVTGSKLGRDAPDFLHVDGGMGDNVRPMLYSARYELVRVDMVDQPPAQRYVVAGRYCESGDVVVDSAELPRTQPGDRLAMPSAGAYTLSMAGNYNGVSRPAVLLLRDGVAHLIQRRETVADLTARDLPLP